MKALVASTVLILSFVSAAAVRAEPLSPAARMKKASRLIRGIDPSFADYDRLHSLPDAESANRFVNEKTLRYLRSPEHAAKMLERVNELFYLSQSEPYVATETGGWKTFESRFNRRLPDAFSQLVFDTVRNGWTWDHLLTARSYVWGDVRTSEDGPDNAFFRTLYPYVPLTPREISYELFQPREMYNISGRVRDTRLAGLLTTSKFADRYANTGTNMNRRRAAAVFRIFLCDPMSPAVALTQAAKEDETRPFIDLAFKSRKPEFYQLHEMARKRPDAHGTDPKCMACHYKIDPMGQSFMGIGTELSRDPSPGALVYKRPDGTLVHESGNGIGDVARALVRQPEYARCQTRHFWDWFMGSDVPLSETKHAELVKAFDSYGRRSNDFIAYLTRRPEFYDRAKAFPDRKVNLFSDRIQPILKKCASCHAGVTDAPDLSLLPIGGDATENSRWIRKIARMLDLKNKGLQRQMPPAEAGWELTSGDIASFREWIGTGAPGADGKPTLAAGEGSRLLEGARK